MPAVAGCLAGTRRARACLAGWRPLQVNVRAQGCLHDLMPGFDSDYHYASGAHTVN
jgi:hypothetical protein